MYKRKAQVIFLDCTGSGAASTAARLTRELGPEWAEARAATLDADTHDGGISRLDDALKEWADLIVYFDPQTGAKATPLPASTRLKHWPLEHDHGDPSPALTDELRQRVAGMIGGMRMLSRLSSDEDD